MADGGRTIWNTGRLEGIRPHIVPKSARTPAPGECPVNAVDQDWIGGAIHCFARFAAAGGADK